MFHALYFLTGSSPRMWGTLIYKIKVDILNRFIPTHVGNSCLERSGRMLFSVHPHACGELS